MKRTICCAAFAVMLAAPALADQPCLMMRNLYSWHEIDKHSVMLEDVGHKRFKVTYSGYCGNLKFVLGIGVKSQSISSLACLERGDMLLARQNQVSFQCLVQTVEPYTGPAPEY
jgi:hypothetical protein